MYFLSLLQIAEKHILLVTPAQAGLQKSQEMLDSRLRGNDTKDDRKGFFSSLLVIQSHRVYAGSHLSPAANRASITQFKSLFSLYGSPLA